MSRTPGLLSAALALLAQPVWPQTVLSARSGVVHYFEGSVSLDGKTLESRLGKFVNVPEGSELRTAQGRAEVLLTPGVVLRLGENSAIRMVSSSLPDTRVELLDGSAMVDSADPAAATSVTVTYRDWNVQQMGKGGFRVDSDPPRVRTRSGKLVVWTAENIEPIGLDPGMELAFAESLAPSKFGSELRDSLSDWADGRAESVNADNSIAANIQDPGSMSIPGLPADNFTYFPMLGLYSGSSSLSNPYGSYPTGYSNPYGIASPYSTGFYSIYLPGYTRRPAFLGLPALPGGGLHLPYSPIRVGLPLSPLPRPPITPISPTPRPIAPPPVPRGGVVRHR